MEAACLCQCLSGACGWASRLVTSVWGSFSSCAKREWGGMKLRCFILDWLFCLLINSLKRLVSKEAPSILIIQSLRWSHQWWCDGGCSVCGHARWTSTAQSTLQSAKAQQRGDTWKSLWDRERLLAEGAAPVFVADSTALQRCDQCGYHISGLALGKVLLENAFWCGKI